MTRRYIVLLCLCFALTAHAQSNFANLHGIVRDPQGHPVTNATVVLTAAATGAARTLVTNADGLYAAPLIVAGNYTVSVTLPGYAPLSQKLTLEVDQDLAVDFHLELASLSQSVSVQGGSIVMDSTKT